MIELYVFFVCTISIVYGWTVCVLYGLNVSVLNWYIVCAVRMPIVHILCCIVANSYVLVVLYFIVYGSVSFVFEN